MGKGDNPAERPFHSLPAKMRYERLANEPEQLITVVLHDVGAEMPLLSLESLHIMVQDAIEALEHRIMEARKRKEEEDEAVLSMNSLKIKLENVIRNTTSPESAVAALTKIKSELDMRANRFRDENLSGK